MSTGVLETLSVTKKYEYLRLYSHQPVGFLTTQPGFTEYHLPGIGYASFARHLGANLVLGDPICAPDQLTKFLDEMIKAVPKPTFVQVSRDCADLLGKKYGYSINSFGLETSVPLKGFSLRGNKKNNLRYAIRQGRKSADVHELTMSELKRDFNLAKSDLEAIFADWMTTRTARHQLKFLIRPAIFEDEPDVRKFYAINERGELQGYVFFSPLYREGRVIGYYNDIAAGSKSAPTGLTTYITMEAVQKFQQEGIESLNLGVAPLSYLKQIEGAPRHSIQVWATLKVFYETANYLYNFKGSHEHKRRYRGEDYPVFIATKWHLRLLELSMMSHYIGILHIKNLPGIKQIYDIWRKA
ncbi:MAG: DUF2156 domain-containing protein [bacterium]|nr:DUF2156 domain-containing protein [bacterium]